MCEFVFSVPYFCWSRRYGCNEGVSGFFRFVGAIVSVTSFERMTSIADHSNNIVNISVMAFGSKCFENLFGTSGKKEIYKEKVSY